MTTFGWVFLATAFLVFMMVANNSWPWVWSKISGNPLPSSSPSGNAGNDNNANNPNLTTPPSANPSQSLSPIPFQIPNPQDPSHPLTVEG